MATPKPPALPLDKVINLTTKGYKKAMKTRAKMIETSKRKIIELEELEYNQMKKRRNNR